MPVYHLTLTDACERLEAARALLASMLDPIDLAAAALEDQAATASRQADRLTG